jgi:hypothetical protein
VNLKTKDVAIARRLVAPLAARAAEVFMGDAGQIDKVQLAGIFKSVLLEHQAKLGLLANIERDRPTVERSVLLEDEPAQGVAYTLLAEQGVEARLETAWQKRLMSEGHGDGFLIKVIEHLERLRDDR